MITKKKSRMSNQESIIRKDESMLKKSSHGNVLNVEKLFRKGNR